MHQRLTPVLSGPQGQQAWFSSVADAEMVISQMQVWQGFKLLGNTNVDVLNGQTVKFEQAEPRPYTGGMQRESAVGLGFQPKIEKLMEGVTLKFSPLLTYEGDTLEAAVELSTNLVRKLHPVKVLAPREVGPAELTLDVPEVSETRLNQPIKNWPLGQVLIISAGVQPGILMDKGGFLNMKIPRGRCRPARSCWWSSMSRWPRRRRPGARAWNEASRGRGEPDRGSPPGRAAGIKAKHPAQALPKSRLAPCLLPITVRASPRTPGDAASRRSRAPTSRSWPCSA